MMALWAACRRELGLIVSGSEGAALHPEPSSFMVLTGEGVESVLATGFSVGGLLSLELLDPPELLELLGVVSTEDTFPAPLLVGSSMHWLALTADPLTFPMKKWL